MFEFDQDGHNPTVYGSLAEMRAEEALPFEERFEQVCGNCDQFEDGLCCLYDWPEEAGTDACHEWQWNGKEE